MPYIFVRDDSQELFELNDNMFHLIIESHKKIGGESGKLKRIRQSDRALPLTLREQFSELGLLVCRDRGERHTPHRTGNQRYK